MSEQTQALARADQSGSYGNWTQEDIKLIKETVANGASPSEFKLFLYTAAKYELDPLIKQIWCVKYGERPAAIFTGRDGFLHIAHKSNQFNGMETTPIRNDKGQLVAARCVVWRKDMTHPFTVEVPLAEYDLSVKPGQTGKPNNWNKMPETMLKKVAESQCLRRAFDISGIYSPEEMDEVQDSTPAPVQSKQNVSSSHTLKAPEPSQEAASAPKPASTTISTSQAVKAPGTLVATTATPEEREEKFATKISMAMTPRDLRAIGTDIAHQLADYPEVMERLRAKYREREAQFSEVAAGAK